MLRPNPTEDRSPSTTRCMTRRARPLGHRPPRASTRSSRRPSPARRGLRINRPRINSVPTGWRDGHRQRLLHPGHQQPVRHDEHDGLCARGRTVRALSELRFVFLESNGGWIVPWLERLDHHREIFTLTCVAAARPVGVLPPAVLGSRSIRRVDARLHCELTTRRRRPDRVGIDYPHPDAKFLGRPELRVAISGLTPDQQLQVAGASCRALYNI